MDNTETICMWICLILLAIAMIADAVWQWKEKRK